MAITNDEPMHAWRNFWAWSAVGAIFYVLIVWGVSSLVREDSVGAILRSEQVAAMLGLGLIFSMVVTGFASRKRTVGLQTLRNFAIVNGVTVVVCLLVIWGLQAIAGAGAMGTSEWVAAIAGSTLFVLAVFGALATASVHTGALLIDDEMAAEDMRERGRLLIYSFVWMAACGLLLTGLSFAGPGGVLFPKAALAGALGLIAVLVVLGIVTWRLSDELGRTLSHEAGNLAFYLILVLGGGWAILAHLGFATGPAPLDWLTLFTVLLFAASFIAVGRRKLFTR